MKRVRLTASNPLSILEPMEGRTLYSHSASVDCAPAAGFDVSVASIEFSLTPTAVQTGLDSLASTDNLLPPAATAEVQLGDENGVETYAVTITGSGTVSKLTVDSAGAAVTALAHTTTTYADLQTSDAAAATGLSAIVTAAADTAIASTDTIGVSTAVDAASTYSYQPTKTTHTIHRRGNHAVTGVITVNASGVPIGNQTVAFSVLPTAVQTGLNAFAPGGATALDSDSAQDVRVETVDGVVLYSLNFTVGGTDTTVTVNTAGAATSLPTNTTADFSSLPPAAQTELETWAAAEGSTVTIASTATVGVYTGPSGAVLYSLQVSVDGSSNTASNSGTPTNRTHDIKLTVDALGNPTVLPAGDFSAVVGGGGVPHGGRSDGGSLFGDAGSTAVTAASKKAAKKAKAAAAKAAKLVAIDAKKEAEFAQADAIKIVSTD